MVLCYTQGIALNQGEGLQHFIRGISPGLSPRLQIPSLEASSSNDEARSRRIENLLEECSTTAKRVLGSIQFLEMGLVRTFWGHQLRCWRLSFRFGGSALLFGDAV